MKISILLVLLCSTVLAHAQNSDSVSVYKNSLDSIYINEVENKHTPDKVLHAEPLFIDLIRDLGARKGEAEWNVGFGVTDNHKHDSYLALVEYEFAPINRLGFELELPLELYYTATKEEKAPSSKLKSLKLATQYSFFVSDKLKTSMAIGYIHEFELPAFVNFKQDRLLHAQLYNPFFVVAKRWSQNFHTLVYAGPQLLQHAHHHNADVQWQVNSNVHYMIDGTRNFIGIELNNVWNKADFDLTIRPQMRLGITDHLLIGIVTGIPIKRENQRFSSFFRLIYEPKLMH